MEEEKDLSTIDKVTSKSSRRNRILGQLKTVGAVVSGTLIALGTVTNPFGIAILAIVGALCGKQAVKHALKVGDEPEKVEE